MKIFALVTGTLRELIARVTLIILASISTLILVGVLLAFSSSESSDGVSLLVFGQQTTPPVPLEDLGKLVANFQVIFAGGLFFGISLFGVFATAGLIPDVLERGTADLYLSKPLPRWQLLAGKSLGAVAAVFLNTLYFIGGIWLVFGLRVGYWSTAFLLSTFSITLVFACLYSLVALSGVLTRNMAVGIIVAFLYLALIGSILEHREQGLYLLSSNGIYRGVLDGLYYVFPQLSAMQDNIAKQIAGGNAEWRPFAQSVVSGGAIYGLAAWFLRRKDF
jgi:ABC-type transport system involved in multi-copper enzyme maturation permease subunit